MNRETDSAERRAFGRRHSRIHGYFLVPGRPPSPCIVRNYSEAGAMIELTELITPPFLVKLRLGRPEDDIECEVRHVRGQHIGLRFVSRDVMDIISDALKRSGKRRRRKRSGSMPVTDDTSAPSKPMSGPELRRLLKRIEASRLSAG